MTFMIDMASAKEYPGGESSCANQRTEKTQLPDTARDDDDPPLQLLTVEATASAQQKTSTLPDHQLDSLLQSIED